MIEHRSQRGSILLGASVLIFIVSLTLAGLVWYRLHWSAAPGDGAASPSPAADVLSPTVSVDSALADERENIQKNLVGPLRQHWATKPERLAAITVTALPAAEDEDEPYRARVSLLVLFPNGEEKELSFRYDLTPWNPSMLDNE